MMWMYGFSGALLIYILVLCVILLCSFIMLRKRIKRLSDKENEMATSLQQKSSVLDKKAQDLEKLNQDMNAAQKQMKAIKRELESQGTEDGLTRLASNSFFLKILKMEWKRAFRFKRPLSLILVNVDYYKQYVDAYGLEEANHCIRKIAVMIKKSVSRSGDLVARLEGAEFAVILPETAADGALTVAERIRRRVESLGIQSKFSPQDPFVTVSCGLIGLTPQTYHGDNLLLEKAREAVKRAKTEGRNCVKL